MKASDNVPRDGGHLPRGVYRKGVQHPGNPWNHPDDFLRGPGCVVLAEFTAEYRAPGKSAKPYLVRLALIAVADHPGSVKGFGWELDPQSPPSPCFVPHFPAAWISAVAEAPGGHWVEVQNVGRFHVRTVGKPAAKPRAAKGRSK